MSSLDLTLLSLYRINGQEWPQLPGLLAQNPPKRPARGREQDRLIVYLTLVGNIIYSSSEYNQIVGQVAETFYSTAGSLTFALKTAVEALNTFLAERNMTTTGKGQYSIGALALAALRGDLLYIVQCGPTHAFTMGRDPHHYHDAQMAGKGLGLSQTTRMYFAQAQLKPNDRVLFCAALPPNWEKTVSEERGPASLEVTRRRLMAANDGNISAVLIQVSEGKGEMNIVKPVIAAPATPPPPPAPKPASPAPAAGGLPAAVIPPKEQILPPGAPAEPPSGANPAYITEEKPVPPPASTQSMQAAALGQESAPRSAPVRPTITIPPPLVVEPVAQPPKGETQPEPEYSPEPKPLLTPGQKERLRETTRNTARFLAKAIGRGREAWQKFRAGVEKFIPRLLPADEDGQSPSFFGCSWPAFVAILVPVLVIVIAVNVHKYVGIPQQVQGYYRTAEEFRQKARTVSDPQLQREYWKTVLGVLDTADGYTPSSSAMQQLRSEAQTEVDALNRVARVDFKPALSATLARGTQVSRMAASDTDVYLLNAASGAVLRGVFNGRNYDLDNSFECRSGNYDGIQVGVLIDIVALPRSNPSAATLLGVDASGNLLYCIPGAKPRAAFLQMPDKGWQRITTVAYDANNLYVLDAPGSAVWVYFGTVEIQFPSKPYYFFESQVPLMMEEAIGIAVNGNDLYLLYSDGHMTTCTLSPFSTAPTRCNDPAIFVDTRPGYQGGIRLADGKFTQIAFTSPPDPSVVLLRPYTQSVFRFSARALELQKELRDQPGKQNPLPEENVTAMAFGPNKSLFLFVGGQLYVAFNVP
jgi:hypothetical protein